MGWRRGGEREVGGEDTLKKKGERFFFFLTAPSLCVRLPCVWERGAGAGAREVWGGRVCENGWDEKERAPSRARDRTSFFFFDPPSLSFFLLHTARSHPHPQKTQLPFGPHTTHAQAAKKKSHTHTHTHTHAGTHTFTPRRLFFLFSFHFPIFQFFSANATPTLGGASRLVASNWEVSASLDSGVRSCSYSREVSPDDSRRTFASAPLSRTFP